KTFSTPHGGGGPGAGPVCAGDRLAPYLPSPIVARPSDEDSEGLRYRLVSPKSSIGEIGSFYGNFGVLVRAYAYIRSLGAQGLREVTENAVINANYLMVLIKDDYLLKYNRRCMHEVVLAGTRQKSKGVPTLAIAKRLIDYGFHPPTIYFPLIVEEALMIEPTETESRETVEAFALALKAIAREVEEDPDVVRGAPYTTPVGRLDEATAARRPYLRWRAKQTDSNSPVR
ncbi:MAG: Glycine dehydrogenase (decarboxylating), partial [Dehalococcoidia bacterium]|nr:Glycine dehydrogenase (decarboxylating) [Dehalococcoidia bacterium]